MASSEQPRPGAHVSTAGTTERPPILEAIGIGGGYGRKQVIFDVTLKVGAGEVVAVLGHNGAGKTTTLKTLFGVLPPKGGRVLYRGEDITHSLSTTHSVRRGLALIPADNFIFGELSVLDNLRLGALHLPSHFSLSERLHYAFELFPILDQRRTQQAGTLSGGERRMLSLAMALLREPALLMLDEPSLGLAPTVVNSLFDTIRGLAERTEMSVLLLEQNVNQALRLADRVYVMRNGSIIHEETAEQMRARDPSEWWTLF